MPVFTCSSLARVARVIVIAIATAVHLADAATRGVGDRGLEIALTPHGESWWISPAGVELHSASGAAIARHPSDAQGFGNVEHFAVSPHDGSLWAVTDAPGLAHFASDGRLLGATPIPTGAASLGVGQEGTVWVAMPDAVLQFSAAGRLVGSLASATTSDTGGARAGTAVDSVTGTNGAGWKQVLVDSLRNRGWLVEQGQLTPFRVDRPIAEAPLPLPAPCGARAAALDGLHGHVFVLCDDAIAMLDASGIERSHLALDAATSGALERLAHDAQSGDLIASGTGLVLRIDTGGRLELREVADPLIAAVQPAPFRVEPSVMLLRPPDGGATLDERQEFILGLGTRCPSGPCTAPEAYVSQLQLSVELNGMRQAAAAIDAGTQRATVRANGVLRPGANRIDAEVRDAFGHSARLPTATLSLLNSPADLDDGSRTQVSKAANKAPSVKLTAPAAGSVFAIGSTIKLSATASDSDGSITKVEFYRAGSKLIGTSTKAPYTLAWSNATAGSHSLTARAYDNRKASMTSAAVAISVTANQPPSVTIVKPADGAVYAAGSTVTLTADAVDADGSITRVEFFDGATSLTALGTAPWTWTWSSPAPGSHTITAHTTDDQGAGATSAPITVNVTDNRPPSVSITAPADGAVYAAGSPVVLTADAHDADGAVTQVEFFADATPLVVLRAAPWSWTWPAPGPGHHDITARATDDRGAVADSAVSSVAVGAPPRVVIAAPTGCVTLNAPYYLPVTVHAFSASSAITKIELFDGVTLVDSALKAPASFTMTEPSAGTHSFTARATDANGFTATSRPAVVKVLPVNQLPTVSLTAPVDGTTFPSSATVTLSAEATDPDGTIASVTFKTDAGFTIGVVTQPPYSFDWKDRPTGWYTVLAHATDSRGATVVSSPVHFIVDTNRLPVVSLIAPANGAKFGEPATIPLVASASDPDGPIARVEFYAGLTRIATDTTEPFTFDWSGVPAKAYYLRARAYDRSGAMTESAPVTVIVATNLPPAVTLTAPVGADDFYAPATIALAATASDTDGGIARVEFHANGTLVGTATTSPYSVVWEGAPTGSYSVTATAYDTSGAAVTTPAAMWVVKPPIGLSITDLPNGATIGDDHVTIGGTLAAPDNSSVTVNGAVAHVDDLGNFHLNDVPLAPGVNAIDAIVTTQDGQTASYSVTVNSSGPGPFAVNAYPTEGIDSLAVTFTVENRSGVSFGKVVFDLDGDGNPDLAVTQAEFGDEPYAFAVTYPAGTWNASVKVLDEQERTIYATKKSIVVLTPERYGNRIRAVYEKMLARLGAGNVNGALTAFTASAYEKYSGIFNELRPDLATLAGQVGTLEGMTFGLDIAELNVVRTTQNGPQQFLVDLIRSEDGIWRIDGM